MKGKTTPRGRFVQMLIITFTIVFTAVVSVIYQAKERPETVPSALACEEPKMQLNISHVSCVDSATSKVEVHFVNVYTPEGAVIGNVTYEVKVPSGETLIRTAPFDKLTGKTAHFVDFLVGYGDGTYDILGGSVVINGITVELHNPGPHEVRHCEPPPTPTPTATPELRVDWKPLAVCDVEPDEVEIRGHNVNSVSIKITGELFALPDGGTEVRISAVPPQYQEVSPDGWGGPEERIRNHFSSFSGVVYGWAEAHTLDGQLIDRFEMKPTRLLCGEEPTPTPTPKPSPTPTPEPTDPAPVCPTCEPHRNEFGNEGEVVMAQTSETACKITWNDDAERWCDGMTPYAMIYSGGHPISVLDLTTMIATPLEAFQEGDRTHYFLEGDAIADPTWRTMKLLYGLHEGQLSWWDLDPDNPERIKSAWEVVGINNVRMEYPCGRTPGVWDVVDGNFNWSVGHNKSEVSLWAMGQFNLTYEDAYDWARQLSEAGVGAELPLPEVST